MKRGNSLLLVLLLIITLLSGCSNRYFGGISERSDGDPNAYTEAILPESENDVYGDEVTSTLFFRYLNEEMLAGVKKTFHVTSDKTIEEMVVQALIDGPEETDYRFSRLIPEGTKIVSVKEQSDYLSITLSSAFLERVEDDIGGEVLRKQLAFQSIVNSVTAIGNFSRVVILVDSTGQGNGSRLTYTQAGWEDIDDLIIDPAGMDLSVVLTADNIMEKVMSSLMEMDYEALIHYLAERDYDGSRGPTQTEIADTLEDKASLVSFSMPMPVQVLSDGTTAVALLDITYNTGSGGTYTLTNQPVRMIFEDVWKVSFASLSAMLPK